MSALLRPQVAAANADLLTALAGLAAEGTLREAAGLDVLLKLPNDLLVAAPCGAPGPPWRKVGGVLVDTAVQGPSVRHAIVSLGLNVHPPAAGWPAPLSGLVTSLAEHVPGVTWRRDDLAAAFLRKLLDVARELAGAESAGAESADGAGGRAADGAGGRAGDGEAAAAIRARHAALAREVPDFELPRP